MILNRDISEFVEPAWNISKMSGMELKDDKDVVIAKRNDTVLLFLDHLSHYRIQQNLLAIKLFMEKPFGRNFDDAGEVIVYPHFLTFYKSEEASKSIIIYFLTIHICDYYEYNI